MSAKAKEQVNQALQFHQSGKLVEAEVLYSKILSEYPENVDALNLMGLLKLQDNKFEDAVFYIKKAVKLLPSAYFYESLGRAYFGKSDFEMAIDSYKKSLALKPDEFDVWFNLALAYKNNKQLDQAIEAYQSALKLNPNSPDVYFNIANVLENKNDTYSALEYYKKADELNIDSEYINYFLAVSYLKIKDFKNGWKYYEDRPSRAPGTLTQTLRYKDKMSNSPLWEGESLENKVLFVYYEAGLGDSIMYVRYLPELKEKLKCSKVLFSPQVNLVSLFKDSLENVEIIDGLNPDINLVYDAHIPIMSLPYILQLNSEADIPFKDKYLKSNPQRVQEYKEKYFNNDKFKIGIKWQGNPAYDRCRIIPLEKFYKLFDLPNVEFYSLQKDDGAEELQNLPNDIEVIDLGATFNDFTDTAAAVENLDLVICNDTSVAHLVGGLGKPCWVILPFVSNWRWHMDFSYSPWYDSVKLFKQKELDNWDGVFDELYKELNEMLSTNLNLKI